MKSARLDALGQEVTGIRVVDMPMPEPGPGQIRVRMLAAPVNPSDLNYVFGTYHQALARVIWNQGQSALFYDPERQRPCPQPPYTLGGEGVGMVDAVGGGFLAQRLLGKRVAVASGPPHGTWQQYTLIDARKAVVLPDALSDEQGAMFFVNPVTAYVLLKKVLKVPRGGSVLLTAAGSALGKSVVRMGRLCGFRTICVVRSNRHSAELRALGADAVIETETQDLIGEVFRLTHGAGVAHAIDCVGGELAATVLRCLGLGGHLVIYGTLGNSPVVIPGRDLMMPVARISGFLLPNWLAQQSVLSLLGIVRTVMRLTMQGVFHTDVAQTFSLDEVVLAAQAAQQVGRIGKVMLRIGER